jgi:hypothetical protein
LIAATLSGELSDVPSSASVQQLLQSHRRRLVGHFDPESCDEHDVTLCVAQLELRPMKR